MNANEKVFVEYYDATCTEDDFEHGEVGGTTSFWTSHDLPVRGGFSSVSDALKAICEANCFDYKADSWINWLADYGEDAGRFDFQTSVCEDNTEACPSEIEEWKAGKRKLYNCYLVAKLSVRAIRPLTAEECATFKEG